MSIPQFELSDRLRKSLEYANVNVEEMAEYLEVHPTTIRNWVGGRTRPRASDVKLWAMRTGVPYSWLAHGETRGGYTDVTSVHEGDVTRYTAWYNGPDGPDALTQTAHIARLRSGIRLDHLADDRVARSAATR